MRTARNLSRVALALSACVMLTGIAQAEGLQVAPVSVTIPARSGVVWLTNQGSAAMRAQVRVFRWTQQDGEDVLAETRDLVASPPFVSIASGDQQVVRLVQLANAVPAGTPCEQTFRIIVDELHATDRVAGDGLQYVMRFSIPVYVTNPACAEIAPALSWQLETTAAGAALLVENTGQQHAQLADLVLADAAGNPLESSAGLIGYVLAGQSRRIPLVSLPAAGAAGTLEVSVNGEKVIAPVLLAASGQ